MIKIYQNKQEARLLIGVLLKNISLRIYFLDQPINNWILLKLMRYRNNKHLIIKFNTIKIRFYEKIVYNSNNNNKINLKFNNNNYK